MAQIASEISGVVFFLNPLNNDFCEASKKKKARINPPEKNKAIFIFLFEIDPFQNFNLEFKKKLYGKKIPKSFIWSS